jgi:tocopherol O-methyltransferase
MMSELSKGLLLIFYCSFSKYRCMNFTNNKSREELTLGIAGFYDRSSKLWEDVWGEHMHHGYYNPPDRTDHQQAQVDLIDEVLKWAEVGSGTNITKVLDAGCGIGGSSRHIARKFGCTTTGITLSPYQANRANELAAEQGLKDQCTFQVNSSFCTMHFLSFRVPLN